MHADALRALLDTVRAGQTGVDEAVRQLQHLPFESLEFAIFSVADTAAVNGEPQSSPRVLANRLNRQ